MLTNTLTKSVLFAMAMTFVSLLTVAESHRYVTLSELKYSVMLDDSIKTAVTVPDSVATESVKKEKTSVLSVYWNVKDNITHNALDSLYSELVNASDSSFVDSIHTWFNSNEEGKWAGLSISLSQPGKYLVKVCRKGYAVKYVPLNVPKFHKHEKYREMGTIYMRKLPREREIDLNEVVVKATKLKFYMDGDTLVYDADAFNLAEGSMLDGLIKMLPGVNLDKNGEITVNGKKVESLLLNGKDFFNSDRELLLENMPAYMVKNIQTYERLPEGVKGTAHEKTAQKLLVMNVKLKKEYNGGWIANAECGAGMPYKDGWNGKRDVKYLGRFFAMHFNDRSRLALFANANNLNETRNPGNNDGEWSPLQQSEGLTTSYTIGANGMYEFREGNRYQGKLNGTYTDSNFENASIGTSFFESGDVYSRSISNNRNYSYRFDTEHQFSLKMKNVFGMFKQVYLDVNPNVRYADNNNSSNSASVELSENVASQLGKAWMDSIAAPHEGETLRKYAITRSLNTRRGDSDEFDARVYMYSYLTPMYNDNISLNMRFDMTHNTQHRNNHNLSTIQQFRQSNGDTYQNRYTPLETGRTNVGVSLSTNLYIQKENSTKSRTLSGEYSFRYSNNHSDNPLYMLEKLDEWDNPETHPIGMLPSMQEMLTTLDTYNSSKTRQSSYAHTPTLSYTFCWYSVDTTSYSTKDNNLTFSLGLDMKHETYDYWNQVQCDTVLYRNTAFFRPSISYYHSDFRRGRQVQANVSMYQVAPSLVNMLDIHNTSNPLYRHENNPNLKNATGYDLQASYNDKFGRTLFNVNIYTNIAQNEFSSSSIYNKETGVTVSRAENINGNWKCNFNSGLDVPLTKGDKWRLKDDLSYMYNHSVDLNGTDEAVGAVRSVVETHHITDKLNLTFRPDDKMEFAAIGAITSENSLSERVGFHNIHAYSFNYGLSAQIELPWKLQFATDITMYSRRGYDDSSMNTNELVWNARLTRRLMKGNLLILLDGFDMLGKLSNVRRYISAQGKTETFYNVIPSYCLLHAIWRLNKQPKKKS